MLGMDQSTPAGPIRTAIRVTVAAQGVPDERLQEIVSWVREHSPLDDALRRAVPIGTTVEVLEG
jgi:hypothetical protein